ncbi:MAG: B12-binding domain-containing radical SAM protein [Bacteroidales bacterium]|nr:B12-binding domain-containing radical SAM protein [Bacteroidales bacterium]MDD4603467.1 B12-binding domain-containing radical SAM protein [Bacteroidales bacterium]
MKDLFKGPTKCLLVQTKFSEFSFWNYQKVCEIVGAKYPAAPLGLMTVAALLPQHWTFKLIDENVEPLLDEDLLWADIICTGGMLPQQKNILEFIRRVHTHGKAIVVGGPDPTSQPDLYREADFLVLGEGEITIPMLLKDLQNGESSGTYVSSERADMLQAVIPRYDLIRFQNYIMVGMQFIRGCPFNCEFCDVIELFGRTPRFKTNEQIIRELQTLYDLGYRGHIDMVDDNFIGNKKKVKELLLEIKKWTIERKYPFYFTTEASVNLADDDELLQLMRDCDFRYVFLGIESPENDTLALAHKNQNVNKPVTDAVRKILSYGMVSNGGYIIGFDSESRQIATNMINSIQDSGITMSMIGLLYALPNTQLTHRLESEGRLFQLAAKSVSDTDIDQTTSGLNFVTLIPRTEILKNYIKVVDTIFKPSNYYHRVIYTGLHVKPKYRHKPSFSTWLIYMRSFLRVCKEAGFSKKTGFQYWKMFFIIITRNPRGIEVAVNLAAMFIHFQKQKDYIISATKRSLMAFENTNETEYNIRMTEKQS